MWVMNANHNLLNRQQALRLLAGMTTGRVIYTAEALPAVLPVRFRLAEDGSVFLDAHAPAERSRPPCRSPGRRVCRTDIGGRRPPHAPGWEPRQNCASADDSRENRARKGAWTGRPAAAARGGGSARRGHPSRSDRGPIAAIPSSSIPTVRKCESVSPSGPITPAPHTGHRRGSRLLPRSGAAPG